MAIVARVLVTLETIKCCINCDQFMRLMRRSIFLCFFSSFSSSTTGAGANTHGEMRLVHSSQQTRIGMPNHRSHSLLWKSDTTCTMPVNIIASFRCSAKPSFIFKSIPASTRPPEELKVGLAMYFIV